MLQQTKPSASQPDEKLTCEMLRLNCLARAVSSTPLRLGVGRKQSRLLRSAGASFSTRSRGDDDDDDEYNEVDWSDDEDFDDDDLNDVDEEWDDWDAAGEQGTVQEHVKQKVSVRRATHSKRRFVDRIRIKATGGHGGNGCSSFFSESAMRKRPNGGHGGAGGNVFIRADARVQNLANATHHFRGGAGLNGMRTSSCP
jgi:hypothetical protein